MKDANWTSTASPTNASVLSHSAIGGVIPQAAGFVAQQPISNANRNSKVLRKRPTKLENNCSILSPIDKN